MKLKFLVYYPFHIKINPPLLLKYHTTCARYNVREKCKLNLKTGGTYFHHFGLELNENSEYEI